MENIIKLFVSQPMRDLTESEIISERTKAVAFVEDIYRDSKVEVIGRPINPITNLVKSINLMKDADLVIFVKGWENAKGCQVEHLIAESYGIDFLEMQ